MKSAVHLLRDLNFHESYTVEGRASVADIFRPENRCGIYVLHFGNGEFYVGQAVDVTRRYVQHCKNHEDIQHISFKQVANSKLNERERETIGVAGHIK